MTSKQVRGSFAVLNANSGQLYRKDQPVYWLKKPTAGSQLGLAFKTSLKHEGSPHLLGCHVTKFWSFR